ncbi:hypothetical protein AURDEDRAFT_125051 [Auricularia subglabra TFB-10046 SS5]|nr:hypothetical protein AURDEDRAFT_125051 [Auricularia subglabra TFB-10046 SS5]
MEEEDTPTDRQALDAGLPSETDTKPSDRPDGYDTLGSELDENARVWHLYRIDVTAYDQNVTIHDWNETLDVLLVFAALFLGVVTSFVIQTYPMLSLTDDAAAPPDSSRSPLLSWIMIALWFISLLLSLIVSLFCILAKQWLGEYIRRLTKDETPKARLWALRRWIYMRGLEEWRIGVVATDGLPLLLHLALFLFAVGLVLLLTTLRSSLAWLTGVITALLGVAYTICTLAPVYRVNAPTATPLLRQFGHFFFRHSPDKAAHDIFRDTAEDVTSGESAQLSSRSTSTRRKSWKLLPRSHTEREAQYLATYSGRELSALMWLLTVSRSEDALAVAFCAVSALPPGSGALKRSVLRTGVGLADALQSMPSGKALRAIDVMRVIRSELYLRPGDWKREKLGLDIPNAMLKLLSEAESADAHILFAAMQKGCDLTSISEHAAQWRDANSSSLPSTVRLLLRCRNIDARTILYLMLPLKLTDICAMRDALAAPLLDKEGQPASSDSHSACTPATSVACTREDFVVAAQLAARTVGLVQNTGAGNETTGTKHSRADVIQMLTSSIPWAPQLRLVQDHASEILGHLHSRDPALGWCRTQGRILHTFIVAWQSLRLQQKQQRNKLARRAGFVLESLLDIIFKSSFNVEVRETVISLLVITFLDTATPLEIAIQNDARRKSDSEPASLGSKTKKTEPVQKPERTEAHVDEIRVVGPLREPHVPPLEPSLEASTAPAAKRLVLKCCTGRRRITLESDRVHSQHRP